MTVYPKRNRCEDCLQYKLDQNQNEYFICQQCGQKKMRWVQHPYGDFSLECENCLSSIAVDQCMPCEGDSFFFETTQLVIEPQTNRISNEVVLKLAKLFHLNGVKMHEKLIQGYTIEAKQEQLLEFESILDEYKITYSVLEPSDPREKYQYYKKCRWPHSWIKIFLTIR